MRKRDQSVQEAFHDFEALYKQFRELPVNSFPHLRQGLEAFAATGEKLILCTASVSPRLHLSLQSHMRSVQLILDFMKENGSDSGLVKNVESTKKQVLRYFEDILSDPDWERCRNYAPHKPEPQNRRDLQSE